MPPKNKSVSKTSTAKTAKKLAGGSERKARPAAKKSVKKAPPARPMKSEPVNDKFKQRIRYSPSKIKKFGTFGRNKSVYPFVRAALDASADINPATQALLGQELIYDPSGRFVRPVNLYDVRKTSEETAPQPSKRNVIAEGEQRIRDKRLEEYVADPLKGKPSWEETLAEHERNLRDQYPDFEPEGQPEGEPGGDVPEEDMQEAEPPQPPRNPIAEGERRIRDKRLAEELEDPLKDRPSLDDTLRQHRMDTLNEYLSRVDAGVEIVNGTAGGREDSVEALLEENRRLRSELAYEQNIGFLEQSTPRDEQSEFEEDEELPPSDRLLPYATDGGYEDRQVKEEAPPVAPEENADIDEDEDLFYLPGPPDASVQEVALNARRAERAVRNHVQQQIDQRVQDVVTAPVSNVQQSRINRHISMRPPPLTPSKRPREYDAALPATQAQRTQGAFNLYQDPNGRFVTGFQDPVKGRPHVEPRDYGPARESWPHELIKGHKRPPIAPSKPRPQLIDRATPGNIARLTPSKRGLNYTNPLREPSQMRRDKAQDFIRYSKYFVPNTSFNAGAGSDQAKLTQLRYRRQQGST